MIKKIKLWMSRKSLNYKLNVSILTCVGLFFLGLVFFISEKSESIIKTQTEDIAKQSLDSYIFDFTHLIEDTEQIIINTKNTLTQTAPQKPLYFEVLLNSALKTVHNSNLNINSAWIYSFSENNVSEGVLYESTRNNDGKIDFHFRKVDSFYKYFPWFKEVPKEEQIFWSEPYIDQETNQTVITGLIPFRFKGCSDFSGLVAITVNLTDIQNNINNFSFYEKGKLLLLSRSGLYITHPNPKIAFKKTIFELSESMNLPELEYAGNDLKAGKSGQFEIPYSSISEEASVFFYAPIKHISWGLCLEYNQNDFLKPIRNFKLIVTISLILSVCLLLLVINKICREATKQLFSLGNIASLYGNGNFSETFEEIPLSKDIAVLSKSLSNMRDNLLKYLDREKLEAAEKQKSVSELEIARNIQQSAISQHFPQSDIFDIYALMSPAKQIGGDFYDFFFIDSNRFAVVVADVSGKGIPAALYMMKAQALIKNITKSCIDLEKVFYHVNNELVEGNDSCMFVTAFIAVIDISDGKVQYINAGHIPPLLSNNFEYSQLETVQNIALGVKKNIVFTSGYFHLLPNERVFMYTDGVTEAENAASKFYGKNRLLNILKKSKISPQDNLNIILNNIKAFADNTVQSDDITMLELVYKGNVSSSLTIAADMKNIKKVITHLKKDMEKHHISDNVRFKIIMAAEEIFSNIVQYAYDITNKAKVCIMSEIKDECYYLTFTDNGKEFNPLTCEMPDISIELKNRKSGGLGIFLVKKLADSLQYERNHNKNILHIGFRLNV